MYIDLICESKNHGDPIFLLSYCTSTNGLHFLVHFKYISPLLRKLPWVLEGLRCKTSQVATFQSPNQSFYSVQFSSVAQSCPTLCDPMNRSTPGLPVHHQLPEFTQPHVHQVSDAIQPSYPLSSPSPPAPNPSQHQSLFQ